MELCPQFEADVEPESEGFFPLVKIDIGLEVQVAAREAADGAAADGATADGATAETADGPDGADGADGAEMAAAAKRAVVGVFDRAAPSYDQDVTFVGPLGEAVVAAAGVRPGDDVADLACGRGAVLFPAAAAVGPTGSVTAFDLAPAMVRLTSQEVVRRGLTNTSVGLGDAERPPVATASVDVVLCGLALFLVPDPRAALAAWARLLRPGGRLAASVFGDLDPLWESEDFPLRRFSSQARSQRRPGLDILAPGALTDALAAAGFGQVVEQLVRCDVVFRDTRHWWEWGWGTGSRRLLENVPPDAVADTINDLQRWLEPATDHLGVHWRPTVRIVAARQEGQ